MILVAIAAFGLMISTVGGCTAEPGSEPGISESRSGAVSENDVDSTTGDPADAGAPSTSASTTVEPWRQEIMDLPPRFAPTMPSGVDELRFAPGMFDASAEDYWSYAFVMRLEKRLAGTEAVSELLDQLYDGLLTAVGRGRGLEMADDAATVSLTPSKGESLAGHVDLVDAFVTGERIRVNLEVETQDRPGGGTAVRVAASPQPTTHAVWTRVRTQLETIPVD